jgi:hypothetical protein
MPTVPQSPAPVPVVTGRAAELAAEMAAAARHGAATAIVLVAVGGVAAIWAGPLAGAIASALAAVVYAVSACLRYTAGLLVSPAGDRD